MDDYYDGDGESVSDTNTTQAPPDDKEKDSGGKTFLINKEVCPGMTVGDKGSFRVTRELESEIECEYISDEKPEESHEPEPAMAQGGGDGMFD